MIAVLLLACVPVGLCIGHLIGIALGAAAERHMAAMRRHPAGRQLRGRDARP